MKKFNFKSRKGFTLIELLVVIGILAVLAAIAIPSVAGLIDRANVSADNTNASEMTNAMERFVSEYELYKQDIASGTLKDGDGDGVPDNMDAAQGRVYNVTKAVTRSDIEKLESTEGLNGIRIDIDTKYAQNHKTAKAVMQNYMKTSSSTFEPKQSDMTYWYNKVTGYTVCAPETASTAELYDKLPSNVLYNVFGHPYTNEPNKGLDFNEWFNLTSDFVPPDFRVSTIFLGKISDGREFTYVELDGNVDKRKLVLLYNIDTVEHNNITVNNAQNKQSPYYEYTGATYLNQFKTNSDKEKIISFRMYYEYNDNGIIRECYTPIVHFTYDMLTPHEI